MIGKRIQQLRVSHGLTLSELASEAKVSKSYLSNIERDVQTNPSIHFLEKISVVLQVDVQQLLSSNQTESIKDASI
ncbi:helix-turn-helix domain-containing protein [Marinicrinis sediminis]|uniref:Helix-turn-helix domain-containing protein n=1 Tax=Marinicrinis sediminis TaxID=1652465 RepID=A0ABW5R910_9BACL